MNLEQNQMMLFCIDYFIKSLPVTTFYMVYVVFKISKKNVIFDRLFSHILITNLFVYGIISILNLTDGIEAISVGTTCMFAVLVYDRDVLLENLIVQSIVCLIIIMFVQIITVSPILVLLDVTVEFIQTDLLLGIIAIFIAFPIQLFIILKVYLKRKEEEHEKN